jgi:glycosyltransferase involved in cell wall biosynthesis
MIKKRDLLIIGKVWPEPDSSAAGSRMMELIRLFKREDFGVVFASSAKESKYSVNLQTYGVEKVSIALNEKSFDDFISRLKPDVVLFDRFMTEEQFGWRVAEQCPGAIRILDTEDLHCLREGRRIALKANREFTNRDLINDVAMREIASVYRCDLSLIISEFEMKLMTDFFDIDPGLLLYLPFMLDRIKTDEIEKLPAYTDRTDFVTIGNFLHDPNWDAVLFLKQKIWPLIRERLPGARVFVYGAYPSEKAENLHQPADGFIVKGRAEDAKEVVRNARVMLAPIRYGAGLKGKLIEAMQGGTPSVTTSIGSESMHGNLPWPGFVTDDPVDFANAAAQLYNTKPEWKRKQQIGYRIINELYDGKLPGDRFINRLSDILKNREKHRLQNFTGAMLMHHTMKSTKYMSKWIEEKNR